MRLTRITIVEALQQAMQAHGTPQALVCDNGPEFTSLDFLKWAARHRIDVQHIQPGKPTQNAGAPLFAWMPDAFDPDACDAAVDP